MDRALPADLAAARRVMERCAALARISEEPDRLTRRFATPALTSAMQTVGAWMQAAGMTVRRDRIGNLIGRYPAQADGAKTLLLGSHLDSVRDAGKYDGPLGVLVALACVERLRARGGRLPYAIDVLAFADEEGLRYGTAYLGSTVVAGTFDPAYLQRTDADGVAMAEAIRAFGGDPDALDLDRYSADEVLGYCEVHIEQGPVLEAENLPVGIVAGICGQSRINLTFTGVAGHAGTVPMRLRHDALCAAAEWIMRVETVARAEAGLVATVGQISAQPGASNVIPGQVTLSLDARHANDAIRTQAVQQLRAYAAKIADQRGVAVAWEVVQESRSTLCAPRLMAQFEQAVTDCGFTPRTLVSGAGHDAVALAALTDVAMLFVRCKGGISHNPAESVALEDVAVAIAVLERQLERIAASTKEPVR